MPSPSQRLYTGVHRWAAAYDWSLAAPLICIRIWSELNQTRVALEPVRLLRNGSIATVPVGMISLFVLVLISWNSSWPQSDLTEQGLKSPQGAVAFHADVPNQTDGNMQRIRITLHRHEWDGAGVRFSALEVLHACTNVWESSLISSHA